MDTLQIKSIKGSFSIFKSLRFINQNAYVKLTSLKSYITPPKMVEAFVVT